MNIHPPDGPAQGIPCGQCGAPEPLDEHSPEPRCADVAACLERRIAKLPPGEQRAIRIRALAGEQCRAALYLIAIEHPTLAFAAIDRLAEASRLLGAGAHEVRVRRSGTGLTAYCDPCQWRVHAESGHLATELATLAAMHEEAR